jgi:multisubunit Na+/H+ antiporter MnhG subunit
MGGTAVSTERSTAMKNLLLAAALWAMAPVLSTALAQASNNSAPAAANPSQANPPSAANPALP